MARKIKPLSSRSAPSSLSVEGLIKRDLGPWEKELEWWRGVGIDTVLLRILLDGASAAKGLYEEQREARRADPLTVREIRRVRQALKRAGPLIRLLKTEKTLDSPPELVFGDLGEQIERSVQSYFDTLDRLPLTTSRASARRAVAPRACPSVSSMSPRARAILAAVRSSDPPGVCSRRP